MIERGNPLQDLDQVLGAELTRSTAGGNELREPGLAHRESPFVLTIHKHPAVFSLAGLLFGVTQDSAQGDVDHRADDTGVP